MSGSLPESLANLANLRNVDLSNNPLVRGTLPTLYAGLSFLQTFDVSGCSITGTLPAEYAALQQLRVFRATNTSISGQLPDSWGLLQNLQVRC
jgi:Leucine-rich repeat (LRR) protein